MPTLEEVMTEWRLRDAQKHGLGEGYVQEHFNRMSNFEFMQALSEAIEEMREHGYFNQ